MSTLKANRYENTASSDGGIDIDSSGKIGINEASPSAIAHIKGAGGAASGNELLRLETEQATGGGWISFNDASARKGYMGYKETGNDGIHIFNEENSFLALGTNGSERVRILSGGGLTFNGDTAAANALNDYEEGTFTPAIFGTSSNPSLTYNEQKGLYTKIGRIVYFHASLQWNARASAGGGSIQLQIPFNANASHSFQGSFITAYNSGLSSQGGFSSYASPNSSLIFIRDGTTNNTLLQCSTIGTSGHLIYGGFFIPV